MMTALTEATRICRVGGHVLFKCQQQVESGRLHDMPRWAKNYAEERLPLMLVDEVVHVRGLGAQPLTDRDGSPRQWQRTQRACSFLIVFRKSAPMTRPDVDDGQLAMFGGAA